jgi:hypothetical protein
MVYFYRVYLHLGDKVLTFIGNAKKGQFFSVRVINFFSITWMICLGSPAFYWNVLMLPSVLWLHAVHKLFPTIWWYLFCPCVYVKITYKRSMDVVITLAVSFYCEGGERICESLTEYLHKHYGLQNLRPSKPKKLTTKIWVVISYKWTNGCKMIIIFEGRCFLLKSCSGNISQMLQGPIYSVSERLLLPRQRTHQPCKSQTGPFI